MKELNLKIFIPPFLLLTIAIIASLVDAVSLVDILDKVRGEILQHFDWLFNWTVFLLLLLLIVIYCSPLGKLKIGGKQATPIFTKFKWFSIVLCTTVATGILFWGSAEPLFHLHAPPSGDIIPNSFQSAITALSRMYMHWTFSPYAIYTAISLLFALAFYQFGLPFRVSSIIRIFEKRDVRWYHEAIDSICLFALVAGMAASLGSGVLTISGGLDQIFSLDQTSTLWAFIVIVIMVAFVTSAATGLHRGIKWLSLANTSLFILMILIFAIILFDKTLFSLGSQALGEYVVLFIPRSLGLSGFDRAWEQSWTSFYWANWMAWAPVSALFLGRLGLGYTVREFIRMNLLYTSLFSILWMTIFGGISLIQDMKSNGLLNSLLENGGPQDVVFDLIQKLNLGGLGSFIFLLIVFISYVTAADSNTSALSGMSSRNITREQPESSIYIKIMWGSMIAIMAWVMVSFSGIEGIKILSVIGGFPVLFLCLAVIFFLVKILWTRHYSSSASE